MYPMRKIDRHITKAEPLLGIITHNQKWPGVIAEQEIKQKL